MYTIPWNQEFIFRNLLAVKERLPDLVREQELSFRQMSLFDDFNVNAQDQTKALTGQI